MSVRNQSQDQIANHSTYTPSGGSHLMLHRAVVASTSLLAMAAALGWSDPAMALGDCGAPSGSGVVNCGTGPFASGIVYAGPAGVEDLTLNIGSFAGHNGAISVGGAGIIAEYGALGGAVSQTVNVGRKVAIVAGGGYDGIEMGAVSFGYSATASLTNRGSVTSSSEYGITVGAKSYAYSAKATTTVSNSGDVAGIQGALTAGSYAYGDKVAKATTTITNSGKLYAFGPGIGIKSYAVAYDTGVNATATGTVSVTNKAAIDSKYYIGIAVQNTSYTKADSTHNATSTATTTVDNSGKITPDANGAGDTAIGVQTTAAAGYKFSYGSGYLPKNAKATATTSITNSGKLATGLYDFGIESGTYANAYGLKSATAAASGSIVNSGKIATSGYVTLAIGDRVEANATAYGPGGSASATGSAIVNNSGAITTTGISAAGVAAGSGGLAYAAQSTATNSGYAGVVNSGAIKTTGATAYIIVGSTKYYHEAANGIYATSYNVAEGGTGAQSTATVNVVNSGAISTAGTFAHGIYAYAHAIAVSDPDYNAFGAAYATVSNSNSIKTAGAGADGIHAFSYAIGGLAPAPTGAYYGTAKAVTTVNNSGAITTTGGVSYHARYNPSTHSTVKTYHGANGIYANAYSVGGGVGGGRSTATVNVANSGAIRTSGDLANGIDATATGIAEAYSGFATGGAYVTVVNSGAITTKGFDAAGILATSLGVGYGYKGYGYSTASATNAGAIKTSGLLSDGINVESKGTSDGFYGSTYASATAINTGSISTKGDGSVGIYVLAGDTAAGLLAGPYANATAVNSGSITTTGVSAAGIAAIGSTYAEGSYVYSAARSTVTNTGSITTSGFGAAGVYSLTLSHAASLGAFGSDANGKTYAASTVTNAGSISTSGYGAPGVAAVAHAGSYAVYYSHAIAASTVTNAGSITTTGIGSHGIASAAYATAYTPNSAGYQAIAKASSTVTNAGSISVSGVATNGILAAAKAYGISNKKTVSATATTMVTNAGSIVATHGYGVLAYSFAYADTKKGGVASTTVANAGSVSATGKNEVGVFAASVAAGSAGAVGATATVINTGGTISASGKGGVGVEAEGAYATTITYAGSTITGGKGAKAMGVYETGAAALVYNGGSIGSANHHAVSLNGLYYSVLTNTGTVDGYVTIATTKASTPKIAGAVAFLNYGTWVAVGGNSTLSHVSGGASSNLVNEGSGTIVVVGNQTFTADTFTNIGFITMQQSATAGLGARPAFETLTVSGDFTGVGGTVGVDASTAGDVGDVLKVKGAVTGGTNIKATIVGTPGATTGNGILVAEAHSTTGASNFDLTGNTGPATPHTLVAGAFEYDLAFVPGSGTSGDWYLQSAGVYPGVYQFGQIGSSAAMVADSTNVSLDDLMSQHFGGANRTALNDDTSMQVASTDNSFVPSPNGPGISGWGRYEESRFNIDPSGSKDANYKLRVDSAQFGGDYDWHNAWNEVVVGGYVTPFHSFSDFSKFGTEIGTSGTNYALYGLWLNGPWEAGLRLNYADIGAHISDSTIGTNAAVKPNEQGVQVAAQYDMPMDWGDLTPSGELNYGTVEGVHFTDGVGDLVNVGRTNDFWGKLNARFSTDVTTDRGLLVQPYANIGLLYRGDSSTNVMISGFSTSTNINGWNGDLAVGVNTNLMANLSLSAQVDYLAGNRVEGWTGFLGLRYTP